MKDVHILPCLVIHIISVAETSVIVQNGEESFLVVEVKEK